MEFVTVRDLRLKPRRIWDRLRKQRDLILTSSGRPIALLIGLEGKDVEDTLAAVRRARAQMAVARLRRAALERGLEKLSPEEVEAEIAETRRMRGR